MEVIVKRTGYETPALTNRLIFPANKRIDATHDVPVICVPLLRDFDSVDPQPRLFPEHHDFIADADITLSVIVQPEHTMLHA